LILFLLRLKMNTVSNRADELLELARDAVQREDFGCAVDLLRKASNLAPMRQDIREILAAILTESPPKALPVSRKREFTPARNSIDEIADNGNVREPFVSMFTGGGEARRRKQEARDVPGFPMSTPDEESTTLVRRTEQPSHPSSKSKSFEQLAGNEVEHLETSRFKCPSTRKPEASDLREQRENDGGSSIASERPFQPESGSVFHFNLPRKESKAFKRAVFAEEAVPESIPTRRRKHRLSETDREFVDESTPPNETPETLSSWRHSMSPRLVAYGMVYGAMLFFTALASSVTYYKFFHKPTQKAVLADSAPLRDSGFQTKLETATPTQEEILRLSTDYVLRKRFDDAIGLLTPVLAKGDATAIRDRIVEQLATSHDGRGTALLETNKLPEAVKSYGKAVELAPRKVDYLLHLANAHYYCGKLLGPQTAKEHYSQALAGVGKAIELDRNSVVAYGLQANVLEELEKAPEAEAALVKIIEIAPASVEAQAARDRLAKYRAAN
jgi:hypothetical protein